MDSSTLIEMTAMRQKFSWYPEVIFIEGTYRINTECYNLSTILVEACNIFGRCVALGSLANEESNTKNKLSKHFKSRNDCSEWTKI